MLKNIKKSLENKVAIVYNNRQDMKYLGRTVRSGNIYIYSIMKGFVSFTNR